jgi:SAM-dependent methyltransferase
MSTPNYEYYGMMAEFWDLFRGDTSTWDDRFFFLDVVKKYGQPVLDVGCGTGRILLDFMQQGFDIDGVDNSPDMLALLHQKAEKLNLNPPFISRKCMHPAQISNRPCSVQFFSTFVDASPPARAELLLRTPVARRFGHAFYDPLETGRSTRKENMSEVTRPEDGATIRRWSFHTL